MFVSRDVERLERLRNVDRGLCFGRLDLTSGPQRYIGRIGLSDDEYEQLLIDWRAPAAEPFYRATAAAPGDVVRRRHIQTRQRKVLAVDDEVFNFDGTEASTATTLSGEAALLASLSASRTGRMSDIVATIQAEQDRVIRSDARGVLVVQGGPGTGKTVAALHRAAYLLYTHRDRLANSGVLVLGPNRTFLRYIDQVLPSLGETGVVLSTVAELYPGITVSVDDRDAVATAKGSARMARAIADVIKSSQRVPREAVPMEIDKVQLELAPSVVRHARTRARRSRRPHNGARAVFVRDVLTALAEQYISQESGLDDDDLPEVRSDLSGADDVQAVLSDLWPALTPEQVVSSVRRSEGWPDTPQQWSASDVPLLDEAAELLGEVPDEAALAAQRRAEAELREEAEFARQLLSGVEIPYGIEIEPELVVERYRGLTSSRPVNERAASDREWAFGHVIVDEAQEISPMAWRMIMRRIPSKSLTVVGDIAQGSAVDGVRSWASVFDEFTPGRWRQETLSINYRAPAEVMAVGADVLAAIDPALEPPQSVRSTGAQPWALSSTRDALPDDLAVAVTDELKVLGDGADGRLGVIAPASMAAALRASLTEALPPGAVGMADPSGLDASVVVLTARESKGLEFDSVIVVEPEAIAERSLTDLYVAVTRPTQRLGVIHTATLPESLARLGA